MTDITAPEAILGLSCAHLSARALHVIAELGTADALDTTPRTADELARTAAVCPDGLDRLLRLLETHGLFACDEAGRWSHTDTSRWLRTDHPRSLRAFARMVGQPMSWDAATALEHTVRTGEPGIRTLDPGGLFGYLDAHPDERAVSQQAMIAKAHADVAAVLAAYDLSRHRRVTDVGGGRGHLLTAVLAAHPQLTGVLFELPSVASDVDPAPRLDIVAGDFFTDPLPPSDAYVLMDILHDWDDTDAAAILRVVARAGHPARATVLIIETVLPPGPEPHWAKTLDVLMLAVTGGRQRTLTGYEALLDAADVDLIRSVATATPFSVIEGRVRGADPSPSGTVTASGPAATHSRPGRAQGRPLAQPASTGRRLPAPKGLSHLPHLSAPPLLSPSGAPRGRAPAAPISRAVSGPGQSPDGRERPRTRGDPVPGRESVLSGRRDRRPVRRSPHLPVHGCHRGTYRPGPWRPGSVRRARSRGR